MSNNKPTVAFGRYPCCNSVRPAPIPDPEQGPINEFCPSCGTRVTRNFNGTLHVITLREEPRVYRNDTRPVFKTKHQNVKLSPFPLMRDLSGHRADRARSDGATVTDEVLPRYAINVGNTASVELLDKGVHDRIGMKPGR
jgi:hypothetical protein